jgi:hypothetical protein
MGAWLAPLFMDREGLISGAVLRHIAAYPEASCAVLTHAHAAVGGVFSGAKTKTGADHSQTSDAHSA